MKTMSTSFKTMCIFTIAVVMHLGCKQKPSEILPVFHPAIAAFTSGTISVQSYIRIMLSDEYPEIHEPNTPVGKKVFKFNPVIEGEAYWRDSRTIEFRPEKSLKYATNYQAQFLVSQLPGLNDNTKSFDFTFQTPRQGFLNEGEGLFSMSNQNSDFYQYRGKVRTADFVEPEVFTKMMSASTGGKDLPIRWIHNSQGTIHEYEIDSIQRGRDSGELILHFDGNHLGVNLKEEQAITIPPQGIYDLVDVSVIQFPTQQVICRFTDPLDARQQLAGLVRLGISGDFTMTVQRNVLTLYPSQPQTGKKTLDIESGVLNYSGKRLPETYTREVVFEPAKPAVRIPGKGTILPGNDQFILPFEAINLRAVEVRVTQLYEENIPFFLQSNQLDGNYEMKRAGRLILKKTIRLGADVPLNLGRWNAFSFDLSGLIHPDPGSVYRIELGFKKIHSVYPCATQEDLPLQSELDAMDKSDFENELKQFDTGTDYWYYNYYDYYDYYDYDYYEYDNYNEYERRRNDPCHEAYYGQRHNVSRNVLASNLGVIAKQGSDGKLTVLVSDILTTRPLQNVAIEVRNFQNRLMAEGVTNSEGFAVIETSGQPFLVIAKQGKQRGYLKTQQGKSLSVSNFDVSGDMVQQGLKGFIYGERGVWRPGDTLFLTFILADQLQSLPQGHPVGFELQNPMGQTVQRINKAQGINGFYTFTTITSPDAPTGNWTAIVKVGGAEFRQRIKIETIKPNRLKIDLDFGREVPTTSAGVTLSAQWLHGATARNLKADVKVKFNQTKTAFKDWANYYFDNPLVKFEGEEKTVFDGRLNEFGNATFKVDLVRTGNAPGMLSAFYTTRVFEEGGDFSIDGIEMKFSPYDAYAGIKVPEMNRYNMLETDRGYRIEVASVNPGGQALNNRKLDISVYRIDWNWWWNTYERNLAQYMRQHHTSPYYSTSVTTTGGKGNFNLEIPKVDWGRYFVKVSDPASGHSTGAIWYFDWPEMAGRARRVPPSAAAMLTFTVDKEKYQPGDVAKITFPSSAGGSAIVSIENGTRVIQIERVPTQENQTVAEIKITGEMIPNVYVHISLLQPHLQTLNDLPIRMYGLMPLMVEDPATKLEPVIAMPETLEPEKPFRIVVSEKNKKEMTFTLAIVDEGLLNLTRFKTPDPWGKFFAREALGVSTWDVYDHVMGAFGGRYEQMFSIGGDDMINAKDASKANRFRPVVLFYGPYTLKTGQSKELLVTLPPYVGSVRTMVVAAGKQAYGSAQQSTPVRKPLMTLATLPRVLGPGETVKLPVTVFAMDKGIKSVNVEVKTNNLLSIASRVQTVAFDEPGDQTIFFDMQVAEKTGIAEIEVVVNAGSEKATHSLEVDVRNPNIRLTKSEQLFLEAGKEAQIDYQLFGIQGPDELSLELSSIPAINLTERLKYLLQYPHGCFEQTVSVAFPQMFLGSVIKLSDEEALRCSRNVEAALANISRFQLPDGSFTTWPGNAYTDEWATSYAGHFMIEAETKGYVLPPSIKNQWLKYQQKAARAWNRTTASTRYAYHQSDLVQAYRLFTLALAGSPETGSMNRLREQTNLEVAAAWRLAASYSLIGQNTAAVQLIDKVTVSVEEYAGFSETYGSRERDLAMILETLVYLNRREQAFEVLQELSKVLGSNRWMSTQTTAYSLLAVSRYLGSEKQSNEMKVSWKLDDQKASVFSGLENFAAIELTPGHRQGKLILKNEGGSRIFVRLFTSGIPFPGQEEATSTNLGVSVRYLNSKNEPINISRLSQGSDFVAEVTISNLSLIHRVTDLALTQAFPSGWEIGNARLFDQEGKTGSRFNHQDIRDDRVMTYFDLNIKEKKVFRISLTAAYQGRFYLPFPAVEAMYDRNYHANGLGEWVEIVP